MRQKQEMQCSRAVGVDAAKPGIHTLKLDCGWLAVTLLEAAFSDRGLHLLYHLTVTLTITTLSWLGLPAASQCLFWTVCLHGCLTAQRYDLYSLSSSFSHLLQEKNTFFNMIDEILYKLTSTALASCFVIRTYSQVTPQTIYLFPEGIFFFFPSSAPSHLLVLQPGMNTLFLFFSITWSLTYHLRPCAYWEWFSAFFLLPEHTEYTTGRQCDATERTQTIKSARLCDNG